MRNFFFLSLIILTFGCSPQSPADKAVTETNEAHPVPVSLAFQHASNHLGPYWRQGKAEISRYALRQNRYKDVYPGEVVMIFVTEDFLTDKQVKNDHYKNPNSVPILKNNRVKTFTTGIYQYSIMTSVFTPVDQDKWLNTLKVTTSTQDWCGQSFMQVNYRDNGYHGQLRSYFEDESDQDFDVPGAGLEEELYNRIRINPDGLPLGKFSMLPSAEYARLSHSAYKPADVEAVLQDYSGNDFQGDGLKSYSVIFPDNGRKLEIVFEKEAPYLIQGWTDTYSSLMDGQPRTTVATRTHTLLDDYWKHNKPADRSLRAGLGLE